MKQANEQQKGILPANERPAAPRQGVAKRVAGRDARNDVAGRDRGNDVAGREARRGAVAGHQAASFTSAWAARSSATAAASCSLFGATPCQATFPSMNETPLPLMVWATMKVGFPLAARASAKAPAICG